MDAQWFAVAERSPGDVQDGRYWFSPRVLELVAKHLDWLL